MSDKRPEASQDDLFPFPPQPEAEDDGVILLTRVSKSEQEDASETSSPATDPEQPAITEEEAEAQEALLLSHAKPDASEPLLLVTKRQGSDEIHTLETRIDEIEQVYVSPLSRMEAGEHELDPSEDLGDPVSPMPSGLVEEDVLSYMSRELEAAVPLAPEKPETGNYRLAPPLEEGGPRIPRSEEELPWSPPAPFQTAEKLKAVSVQISQEAPSQESIVPLAPLPVDQTAEEAPDSGAMIFQSAAMIPVNPSSKVTSTATPLPYFQLAPPEDLISVNQGQAGTPANTHVDEDVSEHLFLRGLLKELHRYCGRACILSHQAPMLLGMESVGMEQATVPIKDLLFPYQLSPTLMEVFQSHTAYTGPLSEHPSDLLFVACLGDARPQQIALTPIIQQNHIVALFYMDDVGRESFLVERPAVDSLLSRAAELDYQWRPPALLELLEQ